MSDDMGLLRTDVEIESPLREGDRRLLRDVVVDTEAALSWAPAATLESLGIGRRKTIRFQQADGSILERSVGFAIVHAGGTFTNDEVVFGEPGDLVLLGARSLEGLNLKVDLVAKRLVSAGPMLAAANPSTAIRSASSTQRGQAFEMRAKYRGRSMTRAGLVGSGCHSSASVRIEGTRSVECHRSIARWSVSTIQYSGTPFSR